MKQLIGTLTTISLLAALVLTACDNQSNRMESAETSVIEADRDLEIAKSEVEAELQIYRIENADRMAEYDRTIVEIKEKINNESDREVRARHETRLQEYEVKKGELNREMDNYRVSGRDNWISFKDNFNDKMDDLGDSLDNFFSSGTATTSSRN